MSSRLLESFEGLRAAFPDRAALFLLSEGRTITFREMGEEADAVRRQLAAAGLTPGAVVIASTGNRPVFVAVLLACLERNLVLVPLDGDSVPAEVQAAAERYGAAAIATVDAGGRLQIELRPSAVPAQGLETACLLKLTSGSTGVPKAVVCREEHIWSDGRHVVEAMGIRPNDVNLGLIPLSHSYGLGNLVLPLLLQGTPIALRPRFMPSVFLKDVEQVGATVFPGVPFVFQHFCREGLEGAFPASLRLLITAGARIDPDTVAEFRQRFGRKIHSFYGASETGGISFDDSEEVEDPLPLGRPLPETEVGLREGRVFVRGTAVATGYLEDSEPEPVAAFLEGGFLTGDLGHFDERGRLFLRGRVSSFVNVAGRKVSPREIERVLLEMDSIAEARVIGAPCERRGQRLVAFVVPRKADLTAVALRRHCSRRLSPYKIPHQFVILPGLPVDARGKLDRRALEALLDQVPTSK